MKKALSILLACMMILSCFTALPAMAEGEITGTVYGNGTVTVEKGSDSVTFTFVPGAANEVKSFTVDGAEVTVTDNQATVAQANTYEAVFEGKAQSLTRETPKVLMENGVVTSVGGVNNNAQDSENKLIIRKTAGTGTDPAVSQYGYDLTRVNSRSDTMHLWREAGDGALCKAAIGRTYRPNVYFKNTHTDKNVDIQIEQLTVDTGYLHTNTSRQVLINNSWAPLRINKINARMPAGQDSVCYKGKDALTITSVYDKDGAGEIQTEDSDWLIMRRLIFVKPGIDNYSGDTGGKIYLTGVSFDETVSYHAIKSEIGEGTMIVSSESLNFGLDNDRVTVKSGTAFAVEDKRNAKVAVKAPENALIDTLTYTEEGGEPTELTEGAGKSVYEFDLEAVKANGTITATYRQGNFYQLSIAISGGNASVTYGGETYTESKTVPTVGAADKAIITAAKGFEIESVTYDGSPVELKSKKTVSVNIENKEATLAVAVKASEEGGVTLYVSPEGSETPDGTIDHPFKTPEEALNEVKRRKDNNLLDEGTITIYLRGGTYHRTSSLAFDSANTGTETSPIVIASYPGERAKFNGGVTLDPNAVQKVTDEKVLNRIIDPYAKTKLMQVDLGAAGAKNLYEIADKDTEHSWVPEFFMNGSAMTMARWPNDEKTDAYVRITSVEGSNLNQPITLGYSDPTNRAKLWDKDAVNTMYIKGGLGYEWHVSFARVGSLDAEKNKLTTKSGAASYLPTTKYGKFFFMNILDEIDVPGEYYIDRTNKMLYFYPITDDLQNSEMVVSQLEDRLVKITDASYITLKDIDFSYSKLNALELNGSHITVDGCTVSNVGANGIYAIGTDIVIENNHVYGTAINGIRLASFDENREKLIPDGNKIINNRIHGTARVPQATAYAVMIDYSCGMEIANNEIYDCGGIALRMAKINNVSVHDNEIYNAVQVSSDNGAIYWGRDITTLGNQVIHNYIHHIGNEYGGYGTQGVFVDDGGSGPYLANNIFYKAGDMAFKTFHGNYGRLENNLFIDTPQAGYFQVIAPSLHYLKIVEKEITDTGAPVQWGAWTANRGKDFMGNTLWQETYKNTQWGQVFQDFSLELFQQIEGLTPKRGTADADKITAFAEKNAPAYVNYFGGNALFGTKVGYEAPKKGANYSAGINDQTKSYFKEYGKDFSLTEAGLKEIQKSVPGFKTIRTEGIGLTSAVGGSAPTASAPVLTKADDGIRLGYRFADADADREGFTKINWYVADTKGGEYTLIRDRHDRVLPLDDSLKGKYVYAELTVYDERSLHGETILSDSVNTDRIEDLTDALEEQLAEAKELLELVEIGEQFGQIPEEAYNRLKSVVEDAKTADMDTVILVKDEIAKFKEAVHQTDGEVAGVLPIYSFMTDKNFTVTDSAVLKLEAGKPLPLIEVSGFVTVDGTKQPATLTIQKGTVIQGSGFVSVNVFGEKEAASVPVVGEKVTALRLTEEAINASMNIELTVKGALRKAAGYVNGTSITTISGSGGYTREKYESDGIKIKTSKLGEIVLYTMAATPTPTPTPTPVNPGGGTTTVPSGGGQSSGTTNRPNQPEQQPQGSKFSDVIGHWAAKEIQAMANRGIVSGVTETTFEPDREITRAEFATLVVKALNLKSTVSAGFTDVAEGAWYAQYVNAAANAGLISGYAGEFRPEDAITREEMAVIIVKTYQFQGGKTESGKISEFSDKDQIADWAVTYADQAISTGFISGMTENTFGPKVLATRAQATAVLYRMLNR